MWLLELKSFRTKKRSSDSAIWVAWSSILALTVVIGAVFTAAQIAAMSHGQVQFFNVRVPTIEDLATERAAGDVALNEKSPFVYVGKEYVTIGSVRAVQSPRPEEDVVLIRKQGLWIKDLSRILLKWKRVREIFPAPVFALSCDERGDVEEQFLLARDLAEALGAVNSGVSEGVVKHSPAPIFVGFASQRLASGSEKNKE